MKTKNNVQKTIFRQVAVIMGFILLSATVGAQGFGNVMIAHNYNVHGKKARENKEVKKHEDVINSHAYSKTWFDNFVKTETESSLKLEGWMLDESSFVGDIYKEVKEEPLELEGWMTDGKGFFSVKQNSSQNEILREKVPEL